jgi:hypothetical protein
MGWLTALKLDVAYVELLMDHPGEKQYAVVMNEAAVSRMRMKSERNNEELASSDNRTDNQPPLLFHPLLVSLDHRHANEATNLVGRSSSTLSRSTPFSSPWTTTVRMKPSSLPSPCVGRMRMKER